MIATHQTLAAKLAAMIVAAGLISLPAIAADEEVVSTARTAPPAVLSGDAASSGTTSANGGTAGSASYVPLQKAPTALSLVHGSAGVSIGTGGYRSAYATAVMPVGDNGILGLAVSQTDYGKNSGYGYGGYGYGDYGYGGYGRYGYGRRTGTSTSAAVMLDLSHNRNSATTPEGCAPGFRDGDRYIEPLWVTRLRGSDSCESTNGH
ncbi:hypothetical protein [Asticcacaulis sp. EMRT-3]|uniref:hypothetical protein n=1 Tax=Asticcacaulis sp. EMRT-3 TaxID=3040349 RepID=UPI0024AEB6CC|nr:hypothetical protein [Asticcacaulis sp. EMRT-3]MDI7775102.1 hypothetical protein [Asticcacaulis sp. EMRT-3]